MKDDDAPAIEINVAVTLEDDVLRSKTYADAISEEEFLFRLIARAG
jgi:hypothetical protein